MVAVTKLPMSRAQALPTAVMISLDADAARRKGLRQVHNDVSRILLHYSAVPLFMR